MKTVKTILLITFALLFSACEETIHVDLDTAAPKLVVEASIDWTKGSNGQQQKIILSTTTDYYNTTFPAVSGAQISISNSANTIFSFIEKPGTGQYFCDNFLPQIGETYTLKIIHNGETYTATESLVEVPKIEEQIDQDNKGGIAANEVEITYYYKDDGTKENYYLSRITDPLIAFPQYDASDDLNRQGTMLQDFYTNEDLKPGDLLNIKLYGISKRYYEYYKKLILSSGNDNNPFQTTPSPVRGNIINQSNSNNFAFGFFRLSEIDSRDYTIK